jgi:hypothetical protein
MMNPGVGLSLGAYDLAEWSSLHPAVRASNPPLLTAFLLRFPLACLALIAAFMPSERRWPRLMLALFLAIALMPPIEFFTQYREDPNYRQQFVLALFAVVFALAALGKQVGRVRRWLRAGFAVAAAVSSAVGLIQAYQLMRGFGLETGISASFYIFIGILLFLAIVSLIKQNRAAIARYPVPV